MNSGNINDAMAMTGIQAVVLSEAERHAMVIRLRERLSVDVTKHAPWDDAAAPDGQLRPDGWEMIPRYVGAATCLMFLDRAQSFWRFKSGADLLRILKECPVLEFYVCDPEASYLLCSNHHDYLIGWGAAQQWVDKLHDTP